MLKVVEVRPNGMKKTVILESDSMEEVNGPGAKTEAIKAALFTKCGISNQSGPYTVDADGNEVNPHEAAPPGFKFRQDYEVMQAL